MKMPNRRLTRDAIEIWQAAVDAVRADRLMKHHFFAAGNTIATDEHTWTLRPGGRVILVGAGKAAFAMTSGMLEVLQGLDRDVSITGWINIPEGTATKQLDPRITVCEARPAGINEPTPKVLDGTQKIQSLLQSAQPNDTVICLLTGGGSALLASPIEGVSLDDKLAVIRTLSARGANIVQLNTVRRALSQVKGGGLVRGCLAHQWLTFIISDVLGDSLESIASGPTLCSASFDGHGAIEILQAFDPNGNDIPDRVYEAIARRQQSAEIPSPTQPHNHPFHLVVANNATAVDVAGTEAVRRGYAYFMQSAIECEGKAESVGFGIADQALRMLKDKHIDCFISGGEPSVVLPPVAKRGRGGRNQHLVLSALKHLEESNLDLSTFDRIAIISGGTDGEDGPTDAAGAWLDADVIAKARSLQLNAADYIERCDAYRFFEQTDSLLKTGATGTNVCDLRIAIVAKDG